MVSPEANMTVGEVLWCQNSSRPLVAVQLWSLLLAHVDYETGQVTLGRDDMAASSRESPENISRIMTELVVFGAISRRRERIAGLRGPGAVRYFVNPRAATRFQLVLNAMRHRLKRLF